MGQINIPNFPEFTPIQELIIVILYGMIFLTYGGVIAALICLFKKTVPSLLKSLSYGAIPLSILCIAVQIWKIIILGPKQPVVASSPTIFLGTLILGLLSWIYLLRRKDRKA
jgi:hypothetical protein